MQNAPNSISLPPFGSVVGKNIDPFGLAKHVGILVPHPYWGAAVLSLGPSGKVIQPVQAFTGGRAFDLVEYPSATHWDVVVWRAETAIVNGQYDLWNLNCDHFVRYCHGLSHESPQAKKLTLLSLFVAGFAIVGLATASSAGTA